MKSVTLILRECGERTAARARDVLLEALDDDVVHSVREAPFTRSLETCYRLGASIGRPWTLVIDADVVVLPSGIRALIEEARAQPEYVFVIQGLVHDRFFATVRPAGNHLYRTRHLARALGHIPADGATLRPESSAVASMARHGFPWVQSRTVVGTHDFEQFHRDIYRKCFLQAHKHREYDAYLRRTWDALADVDDDFRVALAAFEAGKGFEGEMRVSSDFNAAHIARALDRLGVEEKADVIDAICPEDHIERLRSLLTAAQRETAASLGDRIVEDVVRFGARSHRRRHLRRLRGVFREWR